MRTWCTGAPGETYLADLVVFGRPFDAGTPGVILPQMYDSPAERERLVDLVNRLGRNRLDPLADAGLVELAHERTAANPLRTYWTLPLERARRLVEPPDTRTIHWVRIVQLGWPRTFVLFPIFYAMAWGFGVVGSVRLVAGRSWLVLALLAGSVAVRVAFHSFAVPHQVGPRYFVEAMPMLVALAALGISWPLDLMVRRKVSR